MFVIYSDPNSLSVRYQKSFCSEIVPIHRKLDVFSKTQIEKARLKIKHQILPSRFGHKSFRVNR